MSHTPSSKTEQADERLNTTSTMTTDQRERTPAPGRPATDPDSRREKARRLQRMRRWSLALADTVAIVFGIIVASWWGRVAGGEFVWVAMAVPTWIFIAKVNNLYDRDNRRIRHNTLDEIPALLATTAITVALVRGATEVFGPQLASGTMLVIGSISLIAAIALRAAVRAGFRRFTSPELTILIGSGLKAGGVARRLLSQASTHIDLTGYMAPEEGDLTSGPSALGINYFGRPEQLAKVAASQGVTRIVVADDDIDPRQILNTCRADHVAVTLVPKDHQLLGPTTELNRLADVPMLDFHFSMTPRSTLVIKRALDLVTSAALLALMAPVLLVAAILIKLDSRGPVFFRQVRIGKDGKPFTMYKLRTMVSDAEEQLDDLIDLDALEEPVFKIPDDPRVTRTGRFLRRSSLDEVPQFINVLRGDMSLVGPRPEEEAVVALYDERQRQRLAVKPGLTGPMQVAGRGSLNFEERLALEQDYLVNMTLPRDIGILLRTPRAVIKGDGAF